MKELVDYVNNTSNNSVWFDFGLQVFQFSTIVRCSDQKNIAPNIKPTATWLLHPIISGEYWTGPECFTVEPGQPNYYELTYHPLTMTSDTQKHQAS